MPSYSLLLSLTRPPLYRHYIHCYSDENGDQWLGIFYYPKHFEICAVRAVPPLLTCGSESMNNIAMRKMTAAARGWIDEISARIAQLKADYDKLDDASIRLSNLTWTAEEQIGGSELIYLEREMTKLEREEAILEEMLSICEPQTLRDVLVMLSVAGYRLSAIDPNEESSKNDIRVLDRTLSRTITLLEKLAGVTLAELGLESYFGRDQNVQELLAAAAKVEAARPER